MITTWDTVTTWYHSKPYFSPFHLVVASDGDSNMRFFRKFSMIRRLVLLIFIISSSRYKIIRCLTSSIVNIQHSLFDLIRCEKAIILERIHRESHLLIRIASHWWRRTADFIFLHLKNWLLVFRRIFFRKNWNKRILKSTTIDSLWFRCLFHFFCYFVFFSCSFSHSHLFRMNALFICSDWFFRLRSHFSLHCFFVFSDLIFSKTYSFVFDQHSFEWDSIILRDVVFRLFSNLSSHIDFEKNFRCIAR